VAFCHPVGICIMSVIIRQIQPEDNPVLAELIREIFREFHIDRPGTVYTDPTTDNLFELFQAEKSIYWVAEEDGVVLGGCGIYPTSGLPQGCAELVKFYLSATSRKSGLGRLLLQMTLNSAKRHGYSEIYLESFPELEQAVAVYKKAGFKHIHQPLGNSGHHACTVWMKRRISVAR